MKEGRKKQQLWLTRVRSRRLVLKVFVLIQLLKSGSVFLSFLHPEVIALSSILSFFFLSFLHFSLLSFLHSLFPIVLPSFLSLSFLNSLFPIVLLKGTLWGQGVFKTEGLLLKTSGQRDPARCSLTADIFACTQSETQAVTHWWTGDQPSTGIFTSSKSSKAETQRPRTELNLLGFADVRETCSDSVLFMEGLSKLATNNDQSHGWRRTTVSGTEFCTTTWWSYWNLKSPR